MDFGAVTPTAEENIWAIQAAEALARLSRCSPSRDFQDEAKSSAVQRCYYKGEDFVRTSPLQLNKTSYKSTNTGSNQRKRLTETEKEERRLQRILANRESARESIRRKQAMQLDLSKKAADLLYENENLKKEKELVMKKYKSLKDMNDSLKLKMADVEKGAKSRETQEIPESFQKEGKFSCNHPSLAPYIWPSVFPLFPSSVSQLPIGRDGPGNFVFVVPVPFLWHCNPCESPHLENDKSETKTSSAQGCVEMPDEANRHISPITCTTIVEKTIHGVSNPIGYGDTRMVKRAMPGLNTVSPVAISHEKPEIVSDVIIARRRRKELMTMKKTSRKNVAVEKKHGTIS